MIVPTPTRRSNRGRLHVLGLVLVTLVVAVSLGACGNGEARGGTPNVRHSGAGGNGVNGDGDNGPGGAPGVASSDDVPRPVRLLAATPIVPVGFRGLASACDFPLELDGNEDDVEEWGAKNESTLGVGLSWSVPAEWENAGSEVNSSPNIETASLSLTDATRRFRTASGGGVRIRYEWDHFDAAGNLVGDDGEPWESFDYPVQVDGGAETTVKFAPVAGVKLGDQETELYYSDPSLYPETGSAAEYMVRIEAFKLPVERAGRVELQTYSFVGSVLFEPSEVDLDHVAVAKILSSFAVPDCAWETELNMREIALKVDLNDDRHVFTAEENRRRIAEALGG